MPPATLAMALAPSPCWVMSTFPVLIEPGSPRVILGGDGHWEKMGTRRHTSMGTLLPGCACGGEGEAQLARHCCLFVSSQMCLSTSTFRVRGSVIMLPAKARPREVSTWPGSWALCLHVS